jgi:nitroimidazol reductase NimA-like FMN-containing flavoprotein (pyridoxamine 5'-phosphate oxidase superfamily)
MIESRKVPQIVDLGSDEISELLGRVNFGHLGVCRNDRPYVIPIHFAYGKPGIYFFTTEGLKTDIIDENPIVCLQVEEIKDREDWRSVIITGEAERLVEERERGRAMELIKQVNPTLSPAWSVRWLDQWVRTNIEVVYRITPSFTSGRRTVKQAAV